MSRSNHTEAQMIGALKSAEFVAALEESMSRPLVPRKGGRPKKPSADARQLSLTSVA